MKGEPDVDAAAPAGPLHVVLLGGFSVRVGNHAVPSSWRLRKAKTLVKLLALADGHRFTVMCSPKCSGPAWTLQRRPTISTGSARGSAGAGFGWFAFI